MTVNLFRFAAWLAVVADMLVLVLAVVAAVGWS